MSASSWKKYATIIEEPKSKEEPSTPIVEVETRMPSEDWKKYATPIEQDEKPETMLQTAKDIFTSIARPVAKFASGAVKSGYAPINAASKLGSYIAPAPSKEEIQKMHPALAHLVSKQAGKQKGFEEIEQFAGEQADKLYDVLDSPYISPDTRAIVDNVAELAGGIATLSPIGSAFKAATIATGAKTFAKEIGAGEQGQNLAELGALVLTGLYSPAKAKQLSSELYKEAEALLPKTAKVPLSYKKVSELKQKLPISPKEAFESGRLATIVKESDELTNSLRKELDKVVLGVNKGDVKSLLIFQQKINESRNALWAKSDLQGIQKPIKRNLDGLAKDVQDLIADYGKTNPQWYSAYQKAQEAHGAIQAGLRLERLTEQWKVHGVGNILAKNVIQYVSTKAAPLFGLSPLLKKSPEMRKLIIKEVIKGTPISEINKIFLSKDSEETD